MTAKGEVDWSPERVEELRRLWIAGRSAREIAIIMKLPTRATACGKLHRLGLDQDRGRDKEDVAEARRAHQRFRAKHQRSKMDQRNERLREKRRQERSLKVALGATKKRRRKKMSSEVVVAKSGAVLRRMDNHMPSDAEPTPFWRLENGKCRWPIDPPTDVGHSEMLCCGAVKAEESSYCETHTRQSQNPDAKKANLNKITDPTIVRLKHAA